jgi:hypothetical protein
VSAAIKAVKQMLRDDEQVSEVGHAVWRLSESLGRQMALLDSRPVTWGDVLTGRVRANLGVADAERVLAKADKLLESGDVEFYMTGDLHSLASWRDQLAAAIETAKTYREAQARSG